MKKLLLATTILAFASSSHAGYLDENPQKVGPQPEEVQKTIDEKAANMYNLTEKERARLIGKAAPSNVPEPTDKSCETSTEKNKAETKPISLPESKEVKPKPVIKIYKPEINEAPKVEEKTQDKPVPAPVEKTSPTPVEEPKAEINIPSLNIVETKAGETILEAQIPEPEIQNPIEPPADNPFGINYDDRNITNYQDPYLKNTRGYQSNEDGEAAPAPKPNEAVIETPPTFKEERKKIPASTKDFLK